MKAQIGSVIVILALFFICIFLLSAVTKEEDAEDSVLQEQLLETMAESDALDSLKTRMGKQGLRLELPLEKLNIKP